MNRFDEIAVTGIIPVVVVDKPKNILPTADALAAAKLNVMEITLRTENALDAIQAVASRRSEILVGAGTVLSLEQCQRSVDAGASFVVTPGFNETVVSWCLNKHIAVYPGCVTPTEIMRALEFGIHVVKFFPAHIFGGMEAIKALSAPFSSMRFIPTGGINAKNLTEYLSCPAVFAVGGTWLCSADDISAGRYEQIHRSAMQAYEISSGVRHLRETKN